MMTSRRSERTKKTPRQSRVNPTGIYDDARKPLLQQLAALERAEREHAHSASTYEDGLTSEQRLAAIKAVIPDTEVVQEAGRWRVYVPRLHTAHDLPEHTRTWGWGETASEAIDNMWWHLTSPDAVHVGWKSGYTVAQTMIVVPLGAACNQWPTGGQFECWVRWNGFMWQPDVVQHRGSRKWDTEEDKSRAAARTGHAEPATPLGSMKAAVKRLLQP